MGLRADLDHGAASSSSLRIPQGPRNKCSWHNKYLSNERGRVQVKSLLHVGSLGVSPVKIPQGVHSHSFLYHFHGQTAVICHDPKVMCHLMGTDLSGEKC